MPRGVSTQGVVGPGGVSAWVRGVGVPAQGGVCPGVCLSGGCLSRGVCGRHPPCEQNDRQV